MNLNQLFEYEYSPTFRDLVENSAKSYDQDDAFILKHKGKGKEVSYEHISFAEFRNQVEALACAFHKEGYSAEPIAVIGKNSYNWILTYFATLYLGSITVPLDKALPTGEAISSIKRSHAKTLVFDAEMDALSKEAASSFGEALNIVSMDRLSAMISEGNELIENGYTEHRSMEIDPEKLAVILFTSGTTSASKAVMLSQRNIMINVYDAITTEPIRRGEVNMAFLPYHHTFGSVGQVVMIAAGLVTTYCDGLKYIQKNIVEYKVSLFVGVPLLIEAIYKKIIASVKKQKKEKKLALGILLSKGLNKVGIDIRRKLFKEIHDQLGGNLKFVISGASAIDPKVVEGLKNFGILAVQGYGLTETSPILAAENPDNMRSGSVGKAMPHVELKLVDVNEEGVGQLVARGPNIMAGYFENPEETAKVFKDGWFYTGDLATIDKDGFVFIKGREKNVIVLKNGKNVYPEELETLVANLPFVEEVFVFGEEKGENDLVVSAKIVYKPDYLKEYAGVETHEEVEKIIREAVDKINDTMPAYKHIKRLILTDQPMIKTTTGKVKRFEEVKAL
ncbi:long-chain acyl-CoA synthetase [Peptostreptococcaceae bacterium pGA-8]|nr:long-chain acyl-CoA synthetase [Peptostreptococcaceae bacterium pGA-8]